MPVRKASGKLRLCGNYKSTIIKVSKLDRHPLPKVDEMFAALAGGAFSRKLTCQKHMHKWSCTKAHANAQLSVATGVYTSISASPMALKVLPPYFKGVLSPL